MLREGNTTRRVAITTKIAPRQFDMLVDSVADRFAALSQRRDQTARSEPHDGRGWRAMGGGGSGSGDRRWDTQPSYPQHPSAYTYNTSHNNSLPSMNDGAPLVLPPHVHDERQRVRPLRERVIIINEDGNDGGATSGSGDGRGVSVGSARDRDPLVTVVEQEGYVVRHRLVEDGAGPYNHHGGGSVGPEREEDVVVQTRVTTSTGPSRSPSRTGAHPVPLSHPLEAPLQRPMSSLMNTPLRGAGTYPRAAHAPTYPAWPSSSSGGGDGHVYRFASSNTPVRPHGPDASGAFTFHHRRGPAESVPPPHAFTSPVARLPSEQPLSGHAKAPPQVYAYDPEGEQRAAYPDVFDRHFAQQRYSGEPVRGNNEDGFEEDGPSLLEADGALVAAAAGSAGRSASMNRDDGGTICLYEAERDAEPAVLAYPASSHPVHSTVAPFNGLLIPIPAALASLSDGDVPPSRQQHFSLHDVIYACRELRGADPHAFPPPPAPAADAFARVVRGGSDMALYSTRDAPHIRHLRVELLRQEAADGVTFGGVLVPSLVWATHRDASSIVGRLPLTSLVDATASAKQCPLLARHVVAPGEDLARRRVGGIEGRGLIGPRLGGNRPVILSERNTVRTLFAGGVELCWVALDAHVAAAWVQAMQALADGIAA